MDFTRSVAELDRQTTQEAKKLFQEGRRSGGIRTAWLMVGAFWGMYHSEKACREGVSGLFRSVNAGMFHFLIYAKQWELQRAARNH